ncbi:MAG: hypothetical protein H6Q15_1287 [Bacteroidetes bacterium]|nr:hypothetical protein [Bacteroidota bacterium]
MNHYLFSSNMKLADIIMSNYRLLSVLSRFNINLGFGDKTINEICEQKHISEDLFLMICNVYNFKDYLPTIEEIKTIEINELISFLKKSHNLFINQDIKEIENSLNKMCSCCSGNHLSLLMKFFEDYKKEVINHLNYEETVVFPYIDSLTKNKEVNNYHINQFEENHTNIEDKLSDLKNIIIKYLPEICSPEQRTMLLQRLFLFQEELFTHSIIEDKILIPLVEEIEKGYDAK